MTLSSFFPQQFISFTISIKLNKSTFSTSGKKPLKPFKCSEPFLCYGELYLKPSLPPHHFYLQIKIFSLQFTEFHQIIYNQNLHHSHFIPPHYLLDRENVNPDKDCGYSDSKESKGPPKLFVVQPRVRPDAVLNSKLSEALNLAQSLEEQQRDGDFGTESGNKEVPPHVIVQNPASRATKKHADKYFGQGTVDTVKCHLNALKDDLDAVFVNAVLTAGQQRNLERAWGMPVLDRVGLIIEIFNAHANTKEAKLQAELAALMYKKTRLVRIRAADGRFTFGAGGEAEVVSARGRGSGGQGFISGAGETELQLQRRRILERRNRLLLEIEERRGGTEGQGLATVAIVGYTNASTLVSALSESDLYSDDRLFATVDPQLKNVVLPSGVMQKKVLLSDTVGFISDLPVQWSFSCNPRRVTEAELLVHVIDSSALKVEDQRSSVLQVLQQIGDGEFEEGEQEFKEYVEISKNTVAVNQGDDNFLEEWRLGMKMKQKSHIWSLENVQRLETSAVTGVGLQGVIGAIESKLDTQVVV
ncbi:hypothetical protein MKW92_041649 [Papaver armeniacum]|nr:hypothetical protein MKW92_041649 [Papaver armeniacum]